MLDAVLAFWFDEIDPQQWWARDPAFDDTVRARFLGCLQQAARGEFYAWRATAAGRLAEVIVLDQFSRNVWRDTPAAFAQDPMALALAQEAVAAQALAEALFRERRVPTRETIAPSCKTPPPHHPKWGSCRWAARRRSPIRN